MCTTSLTMSTRTGSPSTMASRVFAAGAPRAPRSSSSNQAEGSRGRLPSSRGHAVARLQQPAGPSAGPTQGTLVMTRPTALTAGAGLVLALGALVLAQQPIRLPSSPPQLFGASVTPAFEGWWDNSDGSHSFLIGYFSRNTEAVVDVPIGPNNKFEPVNPDMGQPTHFLPRRHFGMFVVNVPKDFSKTQKITWTLTVAGNTVGIPFHMHTDYGISAFKSTEEASGRRFNEP